jgi:hypothetical protein
MRTALEALIEAEPETITAPNGAILPALVTAPTLDSEFMPGAEVLDKSIRARVSTSALTETPDLQGVWVVRGKSMRLTRVEPHPSSILLILEDEKN